MHHHLPSPAYRSRALILSDRAYRILLAVYPAKFRQRYGPEMAQVFRTCCRAAYDSSGASGVLGLWLPTLWDWAWSAVGEWFSSLFGRSKVYNIHPRRAGSQLIPLLFFLNACLMLLFVTPCSWVFGEPLLGEHCWLEVYNQSGKTLRVTPIVTDRNSFSAVRLYRTTYPFFSAYQQRNITVKSGDQVLLSYNCDQPGVPVLYACDLDGECYIHQHSQYLDWGGRGFIFMSLESLSRPDEALEAAVQSFPEHNYSGLRNVLLCFIQIIFLIGGFYWLGRARTVEIPKGDI
jgi:hypothetical protein